MRKYITCLIGILCMAFAGVCFAGRNEIASFRAELDSISLIAEDDKEYPVPGASGVITLESNKPIYATVGEGKDLPNGKYKAVKYVIKNRFSASGVVTLDNGEQYGSVGGDIDGDPRPVFKKNQGPKIFTCSTVKSPDGTKWEHKEDPNDPNSPVWLTQIVVGDKLEMTQTDASTRFELNENKATTLTFSVDLRWLWFGKSNEDGSFRSADWVKNPSDLGYNSGEYFTIINSDTIKAPFIQNLQIVVK